MSRTDSHDPEWVAVARALPWQVREHHSVLCADGMRSGRWSGRLLRECDIDGAAKHCIRYLAKGHGRLPLDRTGTLMRSERSRVSAQLRTAAVQYNTQGHVETEVAQYDEGHCLCWDHGPRAR